MSDPVLEQSPFLCNAMHSVERSRIGSSIPPTEPVYQQSTEKP